MSIANESAAINASQGDVSYSLVFVDDNPGQETVLMRVTFASGEIHEERVGRNAADVMNRP